MRDNRNCFITNALCSDVSGVEKEFLLAGATSGIVSENSGYWIKKNIKEGNDRRIKLMTFTLEEVLKGLDCPLFIDFLSIDVEGHEYDILKNFPFDKYIIDIICLENNSSIDETDNIDNVKRKLESNDYFLSRNRLAFGMQYCSLRTKLALFMDSLRLLVKGRKWQKMGVVDFYLGRMGKGSWGK